MAERGNQVTIRKVAGLGRQLLLGYAHTGKIDRMRNPQAMGVGCATQD